MNFPFYEQAPKEIVRFCNLCGSARWEILKQRDRYGLDTPTAKCLVCGLVCLSCRMTPEAYREFYRDGHYRELLTRFWRRPMGGAQMWEDQARYARQLSRWLSPFMNGVCGGLLLDLGGSTGIVSELLAKHYNFDATVVEPSKAEADKAQARGLTVANVPIEDYSPNGNHYDLILLCRTVDHLLDIRGVLEKVRAWLAPGGLFFLDFVAVTPPKIDHPYYLTEPTMRRYLETTGFKVKTIGMMDNRHASVLCGGA